MAYIGKSPTGSGVRQRYVYTATGGETSLSGTDDNGKTLVFTDGEYVDVYLNGVLLVQGSDYGVGTTNTISGLTALTAGQVVEIIVYDIYSVAKINSEAIRYRYYKTATGGETSISGADDNGATITFPANAQIDVYLNGISLVAGTDYNTTTANTVGGLAALSSGDIVEIIYYTKFVLSDTVSKGSGGTFEKSIGVNGDLTVDTDTLYVDSTNNRVGVGTTSPEANMHISAGDASIAPSSLANTLFIENSGNSGITIASGTASQGAIRFADSGGNGRGSVRYDHNGDYMRVDVNGSEKMRILSSGGITFNGDTASANALDDYEEGTWTPTLNTGTCNTGYAKYTKIGNLVRVHAQLSSFSDRGASSAVIVNGLPFTSASNNRSSQGVMARYVNSGGDAVAAYIFQSSSQVVFYACNQGAGYTQVQHAHLNSSNSILFISITYLV